MYRFKKQALLSSQLMDWKHLSGMHLNNYLKCNNIIELW